MHHCPHCGAALREHARFCPICMTALNQKRVVPTPKYFPLRWLSAAAAVLVFVAAVWGGFRWWPQGEQAAIAPPATKTATTSTATTTTTSTAATTTLSAGTALSTTLTTLAETFSTTMESTATTTTTRRSISYPTYATIPTAPRVTTASTTVPTTASTVAPTTTTTTTKAPTTTTATTRPYWQDVTPASFTEDGLPIEEVTWTYEPITSSSLGFYRCTDTDYPHISGNSTSRTATPSGVPVNQCIKVTGCIGTTSNGIYRVPAMIDGKTVAVVDFGDTFADKSVALTVKRIYLPPDALRFQGGIENCTKLEGLYMTSPDFWLYPDHVPDCGTYSWGGVTYYNLTLYVPYDFNPIFIQYYSPYVWLYACKGNVYDAEAGMLTDQKCQALYGVAAA